MCVLYRWLVVRAGVALKEQLGGQYIIQLRNDKGTELKTMSMSEEKETIKKY